MIVIGFLHLAVTALLVVTCLPLLRGQVPRNAWYGVWIPAALASDEAWYACNAYFARRMLGWTVPFGLWALAEVAWIDRMPLPWRHYMPLGSLLFLAVPIIQALRWTPSRG